MDTLHPLQPDICFVTKVAWAVIASAIPFLCNFRANFALRFAAAKAQMQVKRQLLERQII